MQGTLSPGQLGGAFRELKSRSASGILHIIDGAVTKRIYFRQGHIVAAESSDAPGSSGDERHSAILSSVFRLQDAEFRFEEKPFTALEDVFQWPVNAALGLKTPLPSPESTLSTTHNRLLGVLKQRFHPGVTIADVLEMSPLSRDETLEGLKALIAAGILTIDDSHATESPQPEPDGEESQDRGPVLASRRPAQKLGRFEVQRVLGRGSMGVVLLAQDPAIDRVVAIKLIQTAVHLSASRQEKYKVRFHREARSAGQLIHPNIVTVFDVGHADDHTPFIVMEHVDGRTLTDILETEALSFENTFQIAHDVLDGLSYAHAQGIVHRDIKPSNIIVTPDFRGKIMDFGIAHVVGSELTADDDVLGSPYYMAPEQLSKGAIDQRTDLFSFAVVLYRLLTGELPFTGDSFAAIAQSILNEEPVPPDRRNPAVSIPLRNVVLRCLEKNPADRYDTAEDVAAALNSARQGTSRSTVMHKVRRSVGKRRDRWLAIAGALVLGAFLVFGLASPNEPELDRTDIAEASTQPATPALTPPDPPGSTVAELYYGARMALERGDLPESRASLEELAVKDPTFTGTGELLMEVTDRIWEKKLPLEFEVRHKHRLGGCNGELSLTKRAVRFTSTAHNWAWRHHEIRVLEHPDELTLVVETFETDVLSLGKNKRYKIELEEKLQASDWVRYQRLTR